MERIAAIAAFVAFGLALVGWASSAYRGRRLKRQLEAVDDALQRLVAGDTHYRLSVRFAGEERTGEAFNRLADQVRAQARALQRLTDRQTPLAEQDRREAVALERRRIARELHDTVNQQLFALHMLASMLERRPETQTVREELFRLAELASGAQHALRGLLQDLRPVELERPFVDAVRDWCTALAEREGWTMRCRVHGDWQLGIGVETQLLRIIQEGLHNVAKHAEATDVLVALERFPTRAQVRIADNGKGFEPQIARRSYGLSTMRERAEEIGGRLDILSKPGLGTQLIVRVPTGMS